MLISLKEYADKIGQDYSSVLQKVRRGNLNAQKIGHAWVIEEDTPYIDNRADERSTRWGKK